MQTQVSFLVFKLIHNVVLWRCKTCVFVALLPQLIIRPTIHRFGLAVAPRLSFWSRHLLLLSPARRSCHQGLSPLHVIAPPISSPGRGGVYEVGFGFICIHQPLSHRHDYPTAFQCVGAECVTYLPLPTRHSHIDKSSSVGYSLLRAALGGLFLFLGFNLYTSSALGHLHHRSLCLCWSAVALRCLSCCSGAGSTVAGAEWR
jgi:hypothetical protein